MATISRFNKTAIFLHIPKTAGSTLHAICAALYPAKHLLHLKGNPHIDTAVSQFKQLDTATRRQIWLLTGHIDYGLHRWLPRPATYFTLLRDPVERVLSYYYFILRTPSHPRYGEMTRRKTTVADFARYILGHNNQTRFLAGTWLADAHCTEEIYAQATQHMMQDFALVGLSEQFDTTVLLLKQRLNWPRLPHYRPRNVTKNRPVRAELDDQTLAAIMETQAYDLRLYRFAQKQFAEAVRQAGLSFWISRVKHQLHQQTHLYHKKLRAISLRQQIWQQWQALRHR